MTIYQCSTCGKVHNSAIDPPCPQVIAVERSAAFPTVGMEDVGMKLYAARKWLSLLLGGVNLNQVDFESERRFAHPLGGDGDWYGEGHTRGEWYDANITILRGAIARLERAKIDADANPCVCLDCRGAWVDLDAVPPDLVGGPHTYAEADGAGAAAATSTTTNDAKETT